MIHGGNMKLTTGYYQQDGATCHISNAIACEKLKFCYRQNYLKKPLATQISRSNACRLLSLGPIGGQSAQKYTPYNQTTQIRYTPRDSSRQLWEKYSRIWRNAFKCAWM
jgi:hypothetical protein